MSRFAWPTLQNPKLFSSQWYKEKQKIFTTEKLEPMFAWNVT